MYNRYRGGMQIRIFRNHAGVGEIVPRMTLSELECEMSWLVDARRFSPSDVMHYVYIHTYIDIHIHCILCSS